MKLRETLETLIVDQLKQRAQLIPAAKQPARKSALVELIARHLLEEDPRAFWRELSELEVKAISESVHAWSGRFDRIRFRAKYQSLPPYFEAAYHRFSRLGAPVKPTRLPLFFYDDQIPEDLLARLMPLAPEPAPNRLETVAEEALPETFETDTSTPEVYPVKRVCTEALVRQDLPAVLRLVERGRVAVGPKTGLASAASIAAIESVLVGGDWYAPEEDRGLQRWAGGPIRPIRPFAWPLLLQAGGLVKLDGSKLALTPKGRKALTEPTASSVKLLFERWQTKGAPDELRRIDHIKGQTSKGARLSALSERRRVIAAALADCPVGEWIDVDRLFRFMQLVGHDFEVTHNPWKLYFADANYGSLGYEGYASFAILQARYALAYLFEYLATLGMIDLVYTLPYHANDDYRDNWGTDEFAFLSRYDGLLYVRINALGAYCLGLNDSYVPKVEAVTPLLRAQSDLRLAPLREPMPAERLLLEQYAEPLPNGYWRLNAEAAIASFARPEERDRLREFLTVSVEGQLSEDLVRFLAVVAERASAVQDAGTARLYECRDAAFAAMLASDPATAPHCLRAGERLIVVPQAKRKGFQKGVIKLGYVLP